MASINLVSEMFGSDHGVRPEELMRIDCLLDWHHNRSFVGSITYVVLHGEKEMNVRQCGQISNVLDFGWA